MPIVSVFDSKQIQVTILALKLARKDLRKEIYARARRLILPEWNQSIVEYTNGNKFANQLILRNTRVKLGNSIQLEAATKTRPTISGGLSPNPYWYLAEFGANPKTIEIRGRRGETRYIYKREVNTWSKPRTRHGRYAFRAAEKMINRTISLWAESTWQILYSALEAGEK